MQWKRRRLLFAHKIVLGPLILTLTSLATPALSGGEPPTSFRLVNGAVVVCSDSSLASEAPSFDEPIYDCTTPQLPAILDCDDAFTYALGEMIGSCEQPSRVGHSALSASLLGDDRTVGKRLCVGDRCGIDKHPARPTTPRPRDEAPMVTTQPRLGPSIKSICLTIPYRVATAEAASASLFRPPRAA